MYIQQDVYTYIVYIFIYTFPIHKYAATTKRARIFCLNHHSRNSAAANKNITLQLNTKKFNTKKCLQKKKKKILPAAAASRQNDARVVLVNTIIQFPTSFQIYILFKRNRPPNKNITLQLNTKKNVKKINTKKMSACAASGV